ncbi:signal-transduction protein with cAMP-binding, CBS, and nucleotidyltransferase domain [Pedobacter sp. UYP30]|uniref:Crp/Fnr family transcriptional regulator n=1 Tax=Pedobacter sp. UYP30 TaxID=1756400 RepID=UPI00339AA8AB
MGEFSPIVDHVSKFIKLTEEEEHFFVSLLRIRKLRKKQFIGQPDFITRYRSFIVSGAVRAYVIDIKGHEHTIGIAIEDWWIGDFASYIFQTPATYFIEALEDSIVIELEYQAEQKLLEANPKFEKFFKKALEQIVATLQQRLLSSYSTAL